MKSALVAALATVALAACTPSADGPSTSPHSSAGAGTGAADFSSFCAGCHGATGRGDGPAAAGMTPAPTNLTLLARNNGGTFPRLQAMSRINGYTMGKTDSPMPAFAELLEGPTVSYDAGDGRPQPTSARLVGLLTYLESIQKR